MSSVDGIVTNDYCNDENADDLEKTLELAAAESNARSAATLNEDVDEKCEKEEAKERDSKGEAVDLKNGSFKRKINADDEEVPAKVTRRDESGSKGNAKLVATHYNALEEKGLDERSKSRIFYMRNFHNWIKSMLINEYFSKLKQTKKHNAPIRVHDMCCGKGGDLLKYKKGNITHLICSDIAAVSVEQCKQRYTDMKSRNEKDRRPANIFSIEYIPADVTRIKVMEKYGDPSMKLDLVSCQFAFHYGFESLPQAECMMENAAKSLQPGSYFIGTTLDANEIVTRARKANSNSFGNELFHVTINFDRDDPPLFGAKYNFLLDGFVDCPEFLVHFPTFVKLAKKHGLKLVAKEKFYDFFERMKQDGRNLLSNMQSLETYPPYEGTDPVGNASDDYVHVKEFLKHNDGTRNVRVGTLSKSEWEAS